MDDNNNPFKKAGIALVAIGFLDIGVMIYSIVNSINYSSSFNIFAVVAGIFLIKGGVKTARVVRWFSVFMVVGFIGMFIVFPIIMPFGLLVVQLKTNTLSFVSSFLFGLVLIAVLVWVHLQLSTSSALQILEQAGYKTGKPLSAYLAALAVIVLVGGLSSVMLNGDAAQKAKSLAQEQLGENYKYFVTSITTSGGGSHAVVTAYNSSEIKNVNVRW